LHRGRGLLRTYQGTKFLLYLKWLHSVETSSTNLIVNLKL